MIARRRGTPVVVACLLLSMLFMVVPLPDAVDWFRPLFPVMVIIYWTVALPERYGVWAAWLAGLLMDQLRGLPLGTHALAWSVVAFAAGRLSARMKVYPMAQQMVVVGVLAGAGLMVQRIAGNLAGTNTASLLPYLLPVLSTAVLWPWALGVQDRLRRIFHVN